MRPVKIHGSTDQALLDVRKYLGNTSCEKYRQYPRSRVQIRRDVVKSFAAPLVPGAQQPAAAQHRPPRGTG